MNRIKESVIQQQLVSVLMAVYNTNEYLDAAIKSVLNQSYRNIQLVIVDDCSTDGKTPEILKNGPITTSELSYARTIKILVHFGRLSTPTKPVTANMFLG